MQIYVEKNIHARICEVFNLNLNFFYKSKGKMKRKLMYFSGLHTGKRHRFGWKEPYFFAIIFDN